MVVGSVGAGGGEKVENGRWIFRWIFKLDIHFVKTGYSKLLPEHTVREGRKSPKKGGKCKKLTLSVQVLRGFKMAVGPMNSGFRVAVVGFGWGGRPSWGYRGVLYA